MTETDGFAVSNTGEITGLIGSYSNSIPNNCIYTPGTADNTMNVLRETRSANIDVGAGIGQIGLNDIDNWPFIQLYNLNPTGNVVVQYNKGGGVQTTILTFDTVDQFANMELDSTVYPLSAQVYATITDVWLNIDPTDEDSWTFQTNTANPATMYQMFDEHGAAQGDSVVGGAIDIQPVASDLMCEDNCILLLEPNSQGPGVNIVTIQDNEDTQIFLSGDPESISSAHTSQISSGTYPITITEQSSRSGVFVTYDEADVSTLRITNTASAGSSASIDYNEAPLTILVGTPPPEPPISESTYFKLVGVESHSQNLYGAHDVDVANGFAYIPAISSNRLSVVDVSDVTDPAVVGTVFNMNSMTVPNQVKVVENYAYVNSQVGRALTVIDVSSPFHPFIHSFVDYPNALSYPVSLDIENNYAFVGDGLHPDILVIDISDVSNPMIANEFSVPDVQNTRTVDVKNNLLYVVEQSVTLDDNSLSIIDISDKLNPLVLGHLDDSLLFNSHSVHVEEDYAYVLSLGASQLVIIDISDKSNPFIVGSVRDGQTMGGANSVQVIGDFAFVTSWHSNSITMIDVSDKTAPVIIDSLTLSDNDDRPRSLQIVDNYAYITASHTNALFVVEITFPAPVFCNDLTIDELISSGVYNVIDNRDGHLDGTTIKGTNGDDLILASEAGNDIRAKKGNDCVIGGAGSDQLRGGNGDDMIFGLDGNDRIIGGNNNDILYGGEGNDRISGSKHNDQLFGENGDDVVNGGNGDDSLSCGDGTDKANGGKGTDTATADCETVRKVP